MIRQYLKQYGPVIALLILFALVFAGVFVLYRLPPEPVWYAAGLCGLLGSVAMAIHFAAWRRQHRVRQRAMQSPDLLLGSLPKPATLIQQDDRAIMESLLSQLRAVQTELHQSQQDSQDYFSAWVHQIKTPLSALRLELQAEDSSEHRAMLAELFSMEQYVDMALCYTRLNTPTRDLVFKPVALDAVIRSVIRSFAPVMIHKRIALRYDGCTETALSDERWLRFMLEQVMSNAVKYTPSGSITLTVTEGPVLTIADTGIGIAPEDVPRVFEKGYTGYNGRGDQKSTGLGLFLCRQTADMLGHSVSLTSAVGEGTIVRFDLHREPLQVE